MSSAGKANPEMDSSEIDIAIAADHLESSIIFHLVKEIIGFVLFMHQQIPSILQDVTLEFDALRSEYNELEAVVKETEVKPSVRRMHMSRMREVKRGIRRLEKLVNTVSSLQTALQLLISEVPDIEEVVLVLGASPIRPQRVYGFFFSHGKSTTCSGDFSKSKASDGISRKAIRALISKGAGSVSYPGASRLFLLVKAPSSFNLPLHFLPKRDFKHSKKVVPFKLRFSCRTPDQKVEAHLPESETGSSNGSTDSTPKDLMWFQCRHVIKGLASKASVPEE